MLFKPKGNSKLAYNNGVSDRKQGKQKSENPYTHSPDVKYASWWDAGWSNQKEAEKEN